MLKQELDRLGLLLQSKWLKLMLALCSIKDIERIGKSCGMLAVALQKSPQMMRMITDTLSYGEGEEEFENDEDYYLDPHISQDLQDILNDLT